MSQCQKVQSVDQSDPNTDIALAWRLSIWGRWMLPPGGKSTRERGWLQAQLWGTDQGLLPLLVATRWGPGEPNHHQEEKEYMKQAQETDLPIWVSLSGHWITSSTPLSHWREIPSTKTSPLNPGQEAAWMTQPWFRAQHPVASYGRKVSKCLGSESQDNPQKWSNTVLSPPGDLRQVSACV